MDVIGLYVEACHEKLRNKMSACLYAFVLCVATAIGNGSDPDDFKKCVIQTIAAG